MIFADEFNPAQLSSASAGQPFSDWPISPSMFVTNIRVLLLISCYKSCCKATSNTCTMQPEEHVQASQEAAAILAPNVETAKMKASNIKKRSKQAVPNKGGVPMKEMVVDAIVTQKERLGSSLSAIKNHLSSKYKVDVNQKAGALNR